MTPLRRIGLLCGAFAALATLTAGLIFEGSERRFYTLLEHDIAMAAHSLASPATLSQRMCAIDGTTEDARSLIAALSLVEKAVTGTAKMKLEWVVLAAYRLTGAEPPDFTYGPLQIRLSRFREAAGLHPEALFDECEAQATAARVLALKFGDQFMRTDRLSPIEIDELSGWFNGQRRNEDRAAGGKLSDAIYRRLTYELVQEFRFHRHGQRID